MLAPHDTVPDISFTDEEGNPHTFAEYTGKWLVIYFYPKDNTPGCTLEAEGFRDLHEKFGEHHAVVFGVSKDSCASHQTFIAKKNLPFMLIADTDHALMEAFGTWGERTFMGKKYMGTSRSTFLVDPEGTIVRVWETVKPAGHPEEVLESLRDLQGA